MNEPRGIDYFNRGHILSRLQARVSVRARARMFRLWKNAARISGQRILDIGTTPDRERQDSNVFVRWCLDAGAFVTLYSPEVLDGLASVFPTVDVIAPDTNGGDEFAVTVPAPDKGFDWSMSSAVLEHVGDAKRQSAFIVESARVARNVFLTTPNRWHWLEFHTKLPLLHWLPKAWHRRLLQALGLAFWAREDNLNLLSKSELLDMARAALPRDFTIAVHVVWALGMPSNLVLIARSTSLE